uniref:Peptidase M41 domain-containing protein n=1 Tax=Ditylenchus dipsaci TaxID=166011 RepID=A0A915DS74_9BILA
MSNRFGKLSFNNTEGFPTYSSATDQLVDEEVREIVRAATVDTQILLKSKKEDINKVAERLMQKKIINQEDMIELLGPRAYKEGQTYEELTEESGPKLDADKGFEARGTPLSEKRLALDALAAVAKPVSKLLQPSIDSIAVRHKRNAEEKDKFLNYTPSTQKNEESTTEFTIDYEEYGMKDKQLGIEDITNGCEQYYAMGKFIPYETLEFLSKAIFEVNSFDELFTLKVMQKLCRLDELIESLPSVKNFLTPRQKSCTDLTQDSIDTFRQEIELCVQNPESLTCTTGIAQQLRNYILQKLLKDLSNKNATIPLGKFYIGSILRIQLSSYNTIQSQQFYHDLLDVLQEEYASNTDLALVGLETNSRDNCWSSCFDYLVLLLQSHIYIGSYVGHVFVCGGGILFYSTVFGITFFPFINLLVIVVAIAIGADDAFLLTFQYEKAKKEIEQCLAKSLNIDPEYSLPNCSCRGSYCYYSLALLNLRKSVDYNALAMRSALRHAAGAMFVTSATTAVAFLTNVFSDILVLSLAAILNIALIILGVTTVILWLGWTINIVEATILVITIGLSFDYTLHVAVAFKYAPDVVNTQKLAYANEAVTVPIFLAMITNVGAGIVLLSSSTQPFYEIADRSMAVFLGSSGMLPSWYFSYLLMG